jgi:hypothetical protein
MLDDIKDLLMYIQLARCDIHIADYCPIFLCNS